MWNVFGEMVLEPGYRGLIKVKAFAVYSKSDEKSQRKVCSRVTQRLCSSPINNGWSGQQ
jgi:hypothetical protein